MNKRVYAHYRSYFMIRHEIERHLVQPQGWKSFYTLTRCSTGLMVILPTASVTRRGPVGLGNALCYHALAPGWRFRSIQNVKFLAPLNLRRLLPCN